MMKTLKKYLKRIGAEELNFRRFMVKEYKGHYYTERVIITISPEGKLICHNKEYAPTKEEKEAIEAEIAETNFPKSVPVRSLAKLKGKTRGKLYEIRDRKDGSIIMVQERRVFKDGSKAYLPWTYFSDGEWRQMEPDGRLPFWKPKESGAARIMIHEGAKAAEAVTALLDDPAALAAHPWGEELVQYEHWGMLGGALAPHRADYSEVVDAKPVEVVYVCDNDNPGKTALQKISRAYNKALKGIIFDQQFPPSWDLADPMPKELFSADGRWLGPKLSSLMLAATWATKIEPNPAGEGRPITAISRDFKEEWLHCIAPEVFVHKDWPNRIDSLSDFNSRVAPFSNVDDTARILKKDAASKSAVLRYSPAMPPGIYGDGDTGRFINTHCPSTIDPEEGDPSMWLEFMKHLVPGEEDRIELMRWCANLIARPDIKMIYGVLLISEQQGVGKGTLGEKILTPIIGRPNVSVPSEDELTDSNFNYWLSHKRLAIIHEIYAGHSAKAYNRLKSIVTDSYVTVKKKYVANYEIENWVHIFACSNSQRALQLSNDDRRWFVPRVSEERRTPAYWDALNEWLREKGGLNIISWWAGEFLKEHSPINAGDIAPMSALKKEIIEEGYSPGQMVVARALDAIKARVEEGDLPPQTFVLDLALVQRIKNELYEGRHNDRLERPATVRKVAKAKGWHIGDDRANIKGWGPTMAGSRILALDADLAKRLPSAIGGEHLPDAERLSPYPVDGI